jgi:hypothetical protein
MVLISASLHEFVSEAFPGRWISCGSATPPSLPWPLRSPNLTKSVNSLWRTIKNRVSVHRYKTNAQLQAAITDAFASLTP